ncbi:MAG: D-aminoacylase [Lewinellaceae bacterium]|nr:D-aminoacylase [Lewinellaceae bacterium]
MKPRLLPFLASGVLLFLWSCSSSPTTYDLILRNAMIYDGSGNPGVAGDLAVNADTIAAIGDLGKARGKQEIDVKGMALSPGFVNMLSWATESLLVDGRGLSDIKQGVTLEVMGEGESMGPLNDSMRQEMLRMQKDVRYAIPWTTLGEYLQHLEDSGIAPNVASFVGATSLRVHEIGYADRPPTPEELERMRALVRQAMEEGALGVGSSLIYAPAFYAKTDELIALCQVAGEYGGMYITHMRSEGNKLLEAVDEVIRIAREAGLPAEIYHLKAAGKNNWPKMNQVIAKMDSARSAGLRITADMYNYPAGATGLDASMPPWVQEGGYGAWAARLQDPAIRNKVMAEMKTDATAWENLYFSAGSADNVLLVGFRADSLRKYTGKTLAEVARLRGKSPEETAMDLVVQDSSRVGTVYFLMSEDNIRKQIQLPYLSFGSDAGALAAEGVFLQYSTHPRAYGNFARLLGKYVRDEQVIPLEEAVRKLSALPCENLKIARRGQLKPGYYADLVVFDPQAIGDRATFENPHQYSVGVEHVFVNGIQVLQDGEPTGKPAGRFVKGPGWVSK